MSERLTLVQAKLQELLQSVQKKETSLRLAERNCIDLVQKLIEKQLIQVVYTRDGKEYITLRQIEREVLDEVLAHGGGELCRGAPSLSLRQAESASETFRTS